MNEPQRPEVKLPDPVQWSRDMAEIAERSQRLVLEFLQRQSGTGGVGMADPLNIGGAFLEMTGRLMADPGKLVAGTGVAVAGLHDALAAHRRTLSRRQGRSPIVEPAPGDRRFQDDAWNDSTLFDFIKQSYLLTARWLQGDGASRSTGSTTRRRRRSISTRASSSTRSRRRTSC